MPTVISNNFKPTYLKVFTKYNTLYIQVYNYTSDKFLSTYENKIKNYYSINILHRYTNFGGKKIFIPNGILL